MTQLRAHLRAEKTQDVIAGELAVTVTFTNGGDETVRLNTHQASHPALVLDVRDGKNEEVLLAPPSAPDAEDLEPGEPVEPGAELTLGYAGFLDRSLPPGAYRVRYFGEFEPLGGSRDDPLSSDWLEFSIRPARGFPLGERIPGLQKPAPDDSRPAGGAPWESVLRGVWISFTRLWWWLWCWLSRRLLGLRCDRLLAREFDEPRTETISNAPAGSEAWNGTYRWRSRFLLTLDEAACGATVTIRVRLVGTITAAQRTAWEAAVEAAWNSRFKLCGTRWCCCSDGMAIVCDLQFVTSGEHQVVNVGASTTNMGNWGANDTVDISHEFGHMLGALDEYFTVNGTNWGPGRQATGAVMNNPANPPAARHYETVRAAAASLLGGTLQTIASGTPCP
jgi:hypothetical protein